MFCLQISTKTAVHVMVHIHACTVHYNTALTHITPVIVRI